MVAALLASVGGEALAALCVWRNPDQDIKEFFGGGNYRTLVLKVGGKRGAIEKAIGAKLDPDETELKYWPVVKGGKRVGTVSSHLGKGDYGAIEVLVAIVAGPDGKAKIKAVKIQRDRERYRGELRGKAFLDQFAGKTAASKLTVGQDIKAAHPQATGPSAVVALSAKKMLVAYDLLGAGSK